MENCFICKCPLNFGSAFLIPPENVGADEMMDKTKFCDKCYDGVFEHALTMRQIKEEEKMLDT